jgi:hypothetical protein
MPKYIQSSFANAVEHVPPVDFIDQAKFYWCQANELLLLNSTAASCLTNYWKKTKKLAQKVARATNSTEMVWAYDDLRNHLSHQPRDGRPVTVDLNKRILEWKPVIQQAIRDTGNSSERQVVRRTAALLLRDHGKNFSESTIRPVVKIVRN